MSTVELVERRWRTELVVTIRGAGATAAAPAVHRTFLGLVEELEAVASRFRPDSELSGLNAAAGSWVPVSGLLRELLSTALAAAEATAGLVDPCLARYVDSAGYRSWAAGDVHVDALPAPDPAGCGAWQGIELAGDRVRIPRAARLDLGATGKAWLADELAERIADDTGLDVVATMGGDLRALAAGEPWTVGIDHGIPGVPGEAFSVTDAGLATSGQGLRRWLTPSGWAHHIIDPRTGRSAASRWWAASVLAASATAANTASTAAVVLDAGALPWLAERGLDSVLTEWPGSGPAVQHLVGRWPGAEQAA